MKLNLIPEWKQAYKFVTVQLSLVMALLATAFEYLPAMHIYFPQNWVQIIAAVIIGARIVQQTSIKRK